LQKRLHEDEVERAKGKLVLQMAQENQQQFEKLSSQRAGEAMEGEGGSGGGAGGPAPLARRKAYRGRRTTEMNQIDESLLILPREEGTN
jgi:hypothetical protein